MQLFKFKNNKSLLKTVLLTMMVFSFTTSYALSEQSLVQTVYASDGGSYTATDLAVSTKNNSNYIKQVDTNQVKVGNFNVYVDGSKIELTDPILVLNGSSFLPMRALGDAINAITYWDASNKVAKVEFTQIGSGIKTSLEVSNNTNQVIVNGQKLVQIAVDANTVAFIEPKSGRTYLPLRAISENLEGIQIQYFNDTRTISITTNSLTPTDPNVPMIVDPDAEKPGESDAKTGTQPSVVVKEGDNIHNGEIMPDYRGKVNGEKSPGGNWRWYDYEGGYWIRQNKSYVGYIDISHIK